jgi:hypothetical protein
MHTGFIFFFGSLAAGTLALSAQNTPPESYPPPAAPLVAPVPDKAQWTISINYSASTPASPAANSKPAKASPLVDPGKQPLTEIRSIKTGKLKQDIMVFADRKPLECWFVGNLILMPGSDGGIVTFGVNSLVPITVPGNRMSPYIVERGNLTQSAGFPGLDWVNMKYYDKVVLVDKVPCYHYLFAVGQTPFAEAWINAQTKLPVRYAGDGVLYTFAFGPTPSADLTLPPAYAEASSAGQKFISKSQLLESAVGH